YAEPIFRLQFCSLILDLTRGTCGKRGCMARIVPNHSAFRKRNQRLSRFLVGLRGNRLTMTAAATATNAVCSANGVQSTRQGQLARRKKGHIIGSEPHFTGTSIIDTSTAMPTAKSVLFIRSHNIQSHCAVLCKACRNRSDCGELLTSSGI